MLNFQNLEINEYSATTLQIVDKGTVTRRNLWIAQLWANSFASASTTMTFRTKSSVGSKVNLQGWNGSAWVTVASFYRATAPYFEIDSIGIFPAADSTQDIGSFAKRFDNMYLDSLIMGEAAARTLGINVASAGLILPNTRPGTPATGAVRYNAAGDVLEVYTGLAWSGR